MTITRFGNLEKVISGIKEALRIIISKIKINTVAMKNFNENELSRIDNQWADKQLKLILPLLR